VAKRTRGSRTAPNRPGARPAAARPANTPRRVTARPVSAPLAPAQPMPSEVGASILTTGADAVAPAGAEAVAPMATPRGSAAIARSTPGRPKIKPNSLLAVKAETEYVYVGRDLRRIVTVGATLFGILLVLWVVLVVLGLSGLY
jgi:hypothetical protein